MNRSRSEPVRTGLVTAKNRKRPVYTGPVRFFGSLGISRTGLGLGPELLRLKTGTGPDFQTLASVLCFEATAMSSVATAMMVCLLALRR